MEKLKEVGIDVESTKVKEGISNARNLLNEHGIDNSRLEEIIVEAINIMAEEISKEVIDLYNSL